MCGWTRNDLSRAARGKNLSRFAGEVDGALAPRVRVIGSARSIAMPRNKMAPADKKMQRAGPITLTLAAARLDLSRAAGEV